MKVPSHSKSFQNYLLFPWKFMAGLSSVWFFILLAPHPAFPWEPRARPGLCSVCVCISTHEELFPQELPPAFFLASKRTWLLLSFSQRGLKFLGVTPGTTGRELRRQGWICCSVGSSHLWFFLTVMTVPFEEIIHSNLVQCRYF